MPLQEKIGKSGLSHDMWRRSLILLPFAAVDRSHQECQQVPASSCRDQHGPRALLSPLFRLVHKQVSPDPTSGYFISLLEEPNSDLNVPLFSKGQCGVTNTFRRFQERPGVLETWTLSNKVGHT